jgi:uncharacterized SAM-binding protein YcdF (DUF218 family)
MTGLEALKPVLTALVLPPVPWLALMLAGARLGRTRRRAGTLLLVLGAALVWLSLCRGTGHWLEAALLTVPPPLGASAIEALRDEGARAPGSVAVLVLGAGRVAHAPETGAPDLTPESLERLRHGLRLGRETGWPVAFSGGVGHAERAEPGPGEAAIAGAVARRDFGAPLRWTETAARDTRENAALALALLRPAGVRHVVLVTHGWHMPRALRDFERAAQDTVRITPAPMGLSAAPPRGLLAWMPDPRGYARVRAVSREVLARLTGR